MHLLVFIVNKRSRSIPFALEKIQEISVDFLYLGIWSGYGESQKALILRTAARPRYPENQARREGTRSRGQAAGRRKLLT